MKKKIIILIVILIIIIVAAGKYMESWMTKRSGDLKSKSTSIPQIAKHLTPFTPAADSWPSWKGPTQDNKASIININKNWQKGLPKQWEVAYLVQEEHAMTWSCPVISGNRLIVPGSDKDRDILFCLDPDNGSLLWYSEYKIKAKDNYGTGQRATPIIDGNRVYTLSRTGDLRCWDINNGAQIWQADIKKTGSLEPEWGFSSSPVIFENKVIVHGNGEAIVIAYDKYNGSMIWKSGKGSGSYSSPQLMNISGNSIILQVYGEGLKAFNAVTGDELWDTEWKTRNNLNISTPVIYNQYIFLSSWYKKGSAVIKASLDSTRELWRNNNMEAHHTDSIIIEEYIYGYSGMSIQNRGKFVCLDLKTGDIKWESSDIGWGTTIYADGHLVCLDIKGNLFLIKPSPEKLKIITSFPEAIPAVKARSWTKPIIANGKIYLRHANRLICYDITEK